MASLATDSGVSFETERNDSFVTANEALVGTAISGQLSSAADLDFFKYNLESAGVLEVGFEAPTDSAFADYFRISVYDASGNLLVNTSTGTDVSLQAAVAAAGTYYVRVDSDSWYTDPGQYSLTAQFSQNNSTELEQEPNEIYANPLLSGVTKQGQVGTEEDIDWFYINTAAPGGLSVQFDAPTDIDLNYFNVYVYDYEGNMLAGHATGQDLSFEVSTSAAGNYFVLIMAGDYLFDDGQYALTVTALEQTQERESETNDTLATANSLVLGESIWGKLGTDDDQDFFVVSLSSSGTFNVNFDAPTDSAWAKYFRIDVFNESGQRIAGRRTGSDIAFDVAAPEAGDYYVVIESHPVFYSDADYSLTVNAVLDEPVPDSALLGTMFGDTLVGTEGNDTIYGLGGNDLIDGKDGQDTAVFLANLSDLQINTINGLTAVRGNYAAGDHAFSVSRLWHVEELVTDTGSLTLSTVAADPIVGTLGSDVMVGTEGDDLIDGLGGSDFIDGDAGNDTVAMFGARANFSVHTVAGVTRVIGNDSTDEYAGQTTWVTNVQSLAFNQNETRALGTTSANTVFGTINSELISGTAFDDVIVARGGRDTVNGGLGEDTLAFFARAANYNIEYQIGEVASVLVTGKAGTAVERHSVQATNIESLAFLDRTVAVTTPAKVNLFTDSTAVTEGASGVTLKLSLSTAPTADVTVSLSGGDQLTPSVQSLTFSATNWNIAQAVTIAATDDSEVEGQHAGELTIATASTDAAYQSLADTTLAFTVYDNDAALTTGSVSGRVWNDLDKDGVIDSTETVLSGWRVFVDANNNGALDDAEVSVLTDTAGSYRFDGLDPGQYVVVAQTATGWQPTYPSIDSASATLIKATNTDGSVSVGTLTQTELSVSQTLPTYQNLGLATNIAAFHEDARFQDIDGQGYSVVVLDTGIDLDHPYFGGDVDGNGVADRIVYHYDFVDTNDADASDGNGHGTHVSGIVGSSDLNYPGIASGINLISLKVLADDGSGSFYDIREAMDWVVANVDQYNIAAVNLSLGDGSFSTSPFEGFLHDQFKTLASNGVVVVSASGNSYNGQQGVSYPSSDPYSLSVGAVFARDGDTFGTQVGVTDAIAAFSQRDDELSDIFAPGVLIGAAQADGTSVAYSGTSMAAPAIAGMVVLAQQLAERELGRRLSFDEVRLMLERTGEMIIDGDDENDAVVNTGETFYRVDMLALAEAVLDLKPAASHVVKVNAGDLLADTDFGFVSTTSVQGLAADDLIYGTSFGELLSGGDGNDVVRGGSGDDELDGGAGDDQLFGEQGRDYLIGSSGHDLLDGGEDNDTLDGGVGNDTLVGGSGTDTVTYHNAQAAVVVDLASGTAYSAQDNDLAQIGRDSLSGIEVIVASDFNDRLIGDALANTFTGGSGNDSIEGGAGDDVSVYRGVASEYEVTVDATGVWTIKDLVDNRDGVDFLKDIELAQFFDVSRALQSTTPTAVASIVGVLAQDERLSVNTILSATDGYSNIRYQWLVDSQAIAGANSATYELTQAEVGKTVSVRLDYLDPLGNPGSSNTVASQKIANVNDAPTGALAVTGTAKVGQTLAITSTVADVDGLGQFSYQWLANGSAISGATAATFTPTAAQVGETISVTASYTDGQGTEESVTSAASKAVQANIETVAVGGQSDAIQSIGITPDGKFLVIKTDGASKTVSLDSQLAFTDKSITADELSKTLDLTPVFKSVVNNQTEYVLPEKFTGPQGLNLDYQLIDDKPNAVVTGSDKNDFIKVANANSQGKAVDAGAGDDVIDGGVGSAFVTGGSGSNTFFLDGRAQGVSWSTITDFKLGTDKATIWGWKEGVSRVQFIEEDGGAPGYKGVTLHFENLLPSDAAVGQINDSLNSLTFSGKTLADFVASSVQELNAQIEAGTNSTFMTGVSEDQYGVHGYLYIA
jgi:Ca2+-binding RTX toxin-like protein